MRRDVVHDPVPRRLFAWHTTRGFASGAAFVLPPYVFRQANMDHFDDIVRQVRDAVAPGSRVNERFCQWQCTERARSVATRRQA